MDAPPTPTDDIETLLEEVCAGQTAAWQQLWKALDPQVEALVRRRRLLGRLSQNEDDRRAVTLQVMARLRQDDFRRLKMYREQRQKNPAAGFSFMAWLTVVARHVAIDYLRTHPDFVATARTDGKAHAGRVLEAQPLPPGSLGPAARPPVTARGTAGELLDYARRELPEVQQRALELWIAGEDLAEIAAALALPEAEAQRTVRAAVERLRRHFRTTMHGGRP